MRARILFISALTFAPGCTHVLIPGGGSELNRAPDPVAITANPEALTDFGGDERERISAVQPIVRAAAKTHGLDPELINGVIWVESRFIANAKSSAGARGLMQLMPATAAYLAKELGVARPRATDPEFNIDAGSYYLKRLLDRFDGDETLAIAAYNAGPGNVRSWQAEGRPLPEYSQDYVAKVMTARARFTMRGPDPSTEAPRVASATNPGQFTPSEPEVRSVLVRVDGPVVPEPPSVAEPAVFEVAAELDRALPVPSVRPQPQAKGEPAADSMNALPPPPGEDVGAGMLPDVVPSR